MTDPIASADEQKHRELMERGRLDLLRPCPACGMCLIGESMKRCQSCDAFANRRREVNDADFQRAIADGLIAPPKTDGA